MNDYDPISPYLKRRIRTLEEAQKDRIADGDYRLIVLRALSDSRARGDRPAQQFQQAVDALMSISPELEESVAVDMVHQLIRDEAAEAKDS